MFSYFLNRSCSTSLTSKGLRPQFCCASRELYFLQHLPDFKGIETKGSVTVQLSQSCSTSLTSKGLRLLKYVFLRFTNLQHLPDFKGIETTMPTRCGLRSTLQHLPDFKGIETASTSIFKHTFNLQHLPDFKGIETNVLQSLAAAYHLAAPP